MRDLVFDTCTLSEFLSQYFDENAANRGYGAFTPNDKMPDKITSILNEILNSSRNRYYHNQFTDTLVIISVYAFIELARKWDAITEGRFSHAQVRALLSDPPEWVSIAPLDEDLVPSLLDVPSTVILEGESKNIELADAIHAATALSRNDLSILVTTDQRLRALEVFHNRCMP